MPWACIVIKLAAAFGNTPEFWLNIQHAVDLWDTRNRYQEEAKLVKPLVDGGVHMFCTGGN